MKTFPFKKMFAAFFAFALLFTGCSGGKLSDYDKIQKRLMRMNSYICEAQISYFSQKSENQYSAKQWVISDGRYRIETTAPEDVKGCLIVYDGGLLWQYNPRLKSKISLGMPDKQERTQINIFTFLNNMVNSQDVSVESTSSDESLCTVFEAKIPGDLKFFSSEKLWVSNDTMNPVKLEIYDTEGKLRAQVAYKNFEYDPKIEDCVFTLEQAD